MRLEGKVALITGASSGIGRESALLLDESGEVISAPERSPSTAQGGRPRAKRRACTRSSDSYLARCMGATTTKPAGNSSATTIP